MVYDDYADIGIFAKWVMDVPEIGERAHPSVGRRCPCTRKGIKLVLLIIIAIYRPFSCGLSKFAKRLRISLPKFVEETFYPSENPVRFRRRFGLGQMKGTLIYEPSFCPIAW